MVSGISASVAGLYQSYQRMTSAAQTIASGDGPEESQVLSAILDLRLAAQAAQANAAALRSEDDLLGTLIDILA